MTKRRSKPKPKPKPKPIPKPQKPNPSKSNPQESAPSNSNSRPQRTNPTKTQFPQVPDVSLSQAQGTDIDTEEDNYESDDDPDFESKISELESESEEEEQENDETDENEIHDDEIQAILLDEQEFEHLDLKGQLSAANTDVLHSGKFLLNEITEVGKLRDAKILKKFILDNASQANKHHDLVKDNYLKLQNFINKFNSQHALFYQKIVAFKNYTNTNNINESSQHQLCSYLKSTSNADNIITECQNWISELTHFVSLSKSSLEEIVNFYNFFDTLIDQYDKKVRPLKSLVLPEEFKDAFTQDGTFLIKRCTLLKIIMQKYQEKFNSYVETFDRWIVFYQGFIVESFEIIKTKNIDYVKLCNVTTNDHSPKKHSVDDGESKEGSTEYKVGEVSGEEKGNERGEEDEVGEGSQGGEGSEGSEGREGSEEGGEGGRNELSEGSGVGEVGEDVEENREEEKEDEVEMHVDSKENLVILIRSIICSY